MSTAQVASKHQLTGCAVDGPSSWSKTNAITQFWFGFSSSIGPTRSRLELDEPGAQVLDQAVLRGADLHAVDLQVGVEAVRDVDADL